MTKVVSGTKWKPIGFRVLIEREDVKRKYQSAIDAGLVLPDSVVDDEQYAWFVGTLLDFGPTAGNHFDGKTFEELGVYRGDTVLFNRYAGLTFKDENGRDLVVCNDSDLNMVWKD